MSCTYETMFFFNDVALNIVFFLETTNFLESDI